MNKSLSLMTVTHNELCGKLPRLLFSIDKYIGDSYIKHIIWDNNSDDGTREWLPYARENNPRIEVILSDVNVFDLPAYNDMVRMCDADIILAINPNTRIFDYVNIDSLLQPFKDDDGVALLGRPGPTVLKENATPHGVDGWGWVSRLLEERDFWEDGDESTAHIQTWNFLLDRMKFLDIGGFQFRNQLFDMRWPEKRHADKPVDLRDKGVMISAEIFLSVMARRKGYTIGYLDHWPFYHYFSTGKRSTTEDLDAEDQHHGIPPLGYQFGMLGEDKFLKEVV